jgi:hypothetical protein
VNEMKRGNGTVAETKGHAAICRSILERTRGVPREGKREAETGGVMVLVVGVAICI